MLPRSIQAIKNDIDENRRYVAAGGEVAAGSLQSLEAELRAATGRRPVRSTAQRPVKPVRMAPCPSCDGVGHLHLARSAAPRRTIAELRQRAHAIIDRDALEPERLMALSRGQVRDLALRKIARRSDRLTPTQADRAEELVRTATTATDGKLVARRIAATDPDEYAVALAKALSQKNPAFTPEEGRAVNVFREVHDAEMRAASESGSFSFGLPWYVDPTIIFTTQDAAEIGSAARVVTITTDAWHGISTPGAAHGFTAEGTVTADGSPTFTAQSVPVFADRFYVPASLELAQDYPGWLSEITRLMMSQWAADVSQYCTVGTGVGQPTGVVTRMAGITQSPSHCVVTTAGQLGAIDLRAAWSALPERYHANASWYCSPSMVSRISSQAAATVTNGLGSSEWTYDPGTGLPRLFGRPVLQSSWCDSFTGTTGLCNYAIVGDFSRFIIAHRSGLDVESVTGIPNFPVSAMPTGQVGVFGMSRYGSDVVDVNAFRCLASS
jgi:HK97 family phage major capsid protein